MPEQEQLEPRPVTLTLNEHEEAALRPILDRELKDMEMEELLRRAVRGREE